jgi:hypothetical protein
MVQVNRVENEEVQITCFKMDNIIRCSRALQKRKLGCMTMVSKVGVDEGSFMEQGDAEEGVLYSKLVKQRVVWTCHSDQTKC